MLQDRFIRLQSTSWPSATGAVPTLSSARRHSQAPSLFGILSHTRFDGKANLDYCSGIQESLRRDDLENGNHRQNLPCNLYVNMLQRLGIEADKFGSSTGTLTGLELSRG